MPRRPPTVVRPAIVRRSPDISQICIRCIVIGWISAGCRQMIASRRLPGDVRPGAVNIGVSPISIWTLDDVNDGGKAFCRSPDGGCVIFIRWLKQRKINSRLKAPDVSPNVYFSFGDRPHILWPPADIAKNSPRIHRTSSECICGGSISDCFNHGI